MREMACSGSMRATTPRVKICNYGCCFRKQRAARAFSRSSALHVQAPSFHALCFGKSHRRRSSSITSAQKLQDEGRSTPSSVSVGVPKPMTSDIECIGTGGDVECVVSNKTITSEPTGKAIITSAVDNSKALKIQAFEITDPSQEEEESNFDGRLKEFGEILILVSPFFFWGTAMVAMKGVLPKAGPLFVAATRLIPAGLLVVACGVYLGRKQPAGINAWLAITLFALVDASCFQGFLTEGLKRTSAGLGSVIIDSQPLTVAVLASILFGETIGVLGILGLITGVIGLVLLEVPLEVIQGLFKGHFLTDLFASVAHPVSNSSWNIWASGEWWMLLAAQSMAIGTVMVRWLCRFADPIMATGWHMILGGLPLLALGFSNHDPALSGHIQDLNIGDWFQLAYASIFGSALSYGVFFYKASKGSLTRLSSLTFLTPMFATFFGYICLDESLSPIQFLGAGITLASIYLITARSGE